VFADSHAVAGGIAAAILVDLTIPDCPPTPEALLTGLLSLLEASAARA
jgi:Ni,Fe-hydrogenase III small subunit